VSSFMVSPRPAPPPPMPELSPIVFRVRTVRSGDNCAYCKTPLTEKVKKIGPSWARVLWCAKCRLEV
jgi:hypothetical protein